MAFRLQLPLGVARALFALVSVAILVAIFTPTPPTGGVWNLDKLFHFLGLGALAVTTVLAFPRVRPKLLWSLLVIVAVFLEILQGLLVPVRDFSGLDMLANVFGVVGARVGFLVLQAVGVQLATRES